ncbi:MAG: ribosomal protein S18-alanine N-acetyltransferase [Dehalococcoidia bacterium]|nr:ribosomal protein S18-alanine N-acetyltransferase [Dehalococcoidia bacterium]
MRTATRYLVRQMRIADIPQVMEVERESFPSMWPPTAYKRELQQNRLAHYIVVVEHRPAHTGARRGAQAPPAIEEPQPRQGGPVGRLLGELRQILGGDDGRLPPPEQREELVLGFVGVWLLPDEAHIVTIAVRDSHRRQGIGEFLLIAAIELAQRAGQPLMTLECRVSNEPALALYEKYGFQQLGLRPRYYSDTHEDALILTTSSLLSLKYQAALEQLKREHRQRWGDLAERDG